MVTHPSQNLRWKSRSLFTKNAQNLNELNEMELKEKIQVTFVFRN